MAMDEVVLAGWQAQAVLVQGSYGRRHPAAVPAVGQVLGTAVYTGCLVS